MPNSSTFALPFCVTRIVSGRRSLWSRPARMRVGQRIGDLTASSTARRGFIGAPAHFLPQRDAGRELVRQVTAAVVLADVEQRGDVGVRQRRGGPGIVQERRAHRLVGERLVADKLERDGPPDLGVARAVDLAERRLRRCARAGCSARWQSRLRVHGVSASAASTAAARRGSAGFARDAQSDRRRPAPRLPARASSRLPVRRAYRAPKPVATDPGIT